MIARKYRVIITIVLLVVLGWTLPLWAGIVNTKHNLSVSGPGPIKSLSTTEVCAFCHTPHHANPSVRPIWNREYLSS